MGVSIQIKGIVQGVGFRPYVWKLATSFGLRGVVRNDAAGVTVEVEGDAVQPFLAALRNEPPPLARITSLETADIPPRGFTEFNIVESGSSAGKTVLISPDVSMCDDCASELFNETDRRFRYPFINCVNCGPRYSIIKDLPYDRPNTSMAQFDMCPDCAREYSDPADRRYHAQPVACPVCGPKLWFYDVGESRRFMTRQDAESVWENQWAGFIQSGKIVAVKGIGGFHLACDALNAVAVTELRRRKARENKPFALMVPDLGWVRRVCEVSEDEERLLTSRERPIVLLRIKADFESRQAIAPDLNTLGVMLPYTPMHHLMFHAFPDPVVMTSANYSSEPMIHANEAALEKLSELADEFLLHDRGIVNRCDDSVAAVYGGQTVILRPGRGLAPVSSPAGRVRRTRRGCPGEPFLAETSKNVLAIGADMKNTFAVAHGGQVTLSPYMGDLENPEVQDILKENVRRYLDCYGIRPELIVHDLHPDYFSTCIAEEFSKEFGVPHAAVQHHHAHCLAAAAEHRIEGRAIGVAFDGTGFGPDGTVWGGEILEFDLSSFDRRFHLRPFTLPGGDKAVRDPKRTLISILSQVERDLRTRLCCSETGISPDEIDKIQLLLETGVNCPLTSSAGRLFDAASVLIGACERPTYDGEAPMRLEALADPADRGGLPFEISNGEIDWRPMFRELLNLQSSDFCPPASVLSARFHNTMAEIIFEALDQLGGSLPVLFAGGVFQNRFLVERIRNHPAFDPARMVFSSIPNDSAIALGQAVFGLNYE